MKQLLILFLPLSLQLNAQIGIGTNNPSTNSILDVTSSNKGLMIPRLNDTTNINNPSEGLMIFNKQAKALAFHDGARWNNVTAANVDGTLTAPVDSITYTITNAVTGFTNGTWRALALSQAVVAAGTAPQFTDLNLNKMLDANSIGITRAISLRPNTSSMVIEIKSYAPGSSQPNFSIKITGPQFSSYGVGIAADLFESVALTGLVVGFKNWVNNTSFAYNLQTNMMVPY